MVKLPRHTALLSVTLLLTSAACYSAPQFGLLGGPARAPISASPGSTSPNVVLQPTIAGEVDGSITLAPTVPDLGVVPPAGSAPISAVPTATVALAPTLDRDSPKADVMGAASEAPRLVPMAPPSDPAALPDWVIRQAEAEYDDGQFQAALDRFTAGPVPSHALDLVALRRAELAIKVGDLDRARREVRDPALAQSTNRIILDRGGDAAEAVGAYDVAADLWAQAAKHPTWRTEKITKVMESASAAVKAGQPERAVALLRTQVENDGGASPSNLVAELRRLEGLTSFHAGLVSLANGQTSTAIASFRHYLAQNPEGDYAAASRQRLEALTAASQAPSSNGWSQARAADTAEAYRAWREANPASSLIYEAFFREGYASYRDGKYEAARDAWIAGASPEGGAEARARALYWAGKANIMLDDVDVAHDLWKTASAIKPSSYYSVRAADRLAGVNGWPNAGVELPPVRPSDEDFAEAESWLKSWAPESTPPADEVASLTRARLFAELGLEQTAGAELDMLIESTEQPATILQAGHVAADHGLWLSSVRAGSRLSRLSPEKAPIDTPRAIRILTYPAGYAPTVAEESAQSKLGPVLMLSLIRQESLFDRFALSHAGALGLTQVMPATGAEIARRIGHQGFTADALYQADLAIDYGARFLGGNLVTFSGDVFRAVAAYNAGAGAAARWAPGTTDPDIFVESIGYAETREYVKSIYVHHAAYRSLLAR